MTIVCHCHHEMPCEGDGELERRFGFFQWDTHTPTTTKIIFWKNIYLSLWSCQFSFIHLLSTSLSIYVMPSSALLKAQIYHYHHQRIQNLHTVLKEAWCSWSQKAHRVHVPSLKTISMIQKSGLHSTLKVFSILGDKFVRRLCKDIWSW